MPSVWNFSRMETSVYVLYAYRCIYSRISGAGLTGKTFSTIAEHLTLLLHIEHAHLWRVLSNIKLWRESEEDAVRTGYMTPFPRYSLP